MFRHHQGTVGKQSDHLTQAAFIGITVSTMDDFIYQFEFNTPIIMVVFARGTVLQPAGRSCSDAGIFLI